MKFTGVKRLKRGAVWADGTTRTCTGCRIDISYERRRRARQATTVATLHDGRFRIPVAYCDGHLPDDLKGTS